MGKLLAVEYRASKGTIIRHIYILYFITLKTNKTNKLPPIPCTHHPHTIGCIIATNSYCYFFPRPFVF